MGETQENSLTQMAEILTSIPYSAREKKEDIEDNGLGL